MQGKIGVLAPGAFADLLILDANPLEDITILDRPEDHLHLVMKEGRVVFSTMPQLQTKEEEEKQEMLRHKKLRPVV